MKKLKMLIAAIAMGTITVFASCNKDEVKPAKTQHQDAVTKDDGGTGGGETPPQLPPRP